MSSGRFIGKTAIVTGGVSGIGAAIVDILMREGARVMIADLNAPETMRDDVTWRKTDVSREDDVNAMIADMVDWAGGVDILFNNAGTGASGPTHEADTETWHRLISVNLDSVFFATRAAIPHMLKTGGGAIVNTASISGIGGDYKMAAYNAAKAGVINFTRSVALEYARSGIRINAVCPGLIDTPLTGAIRARPGLWDSWVDSIPMGRAGKPSEIAELATFLASDAASFMTGSIVTADGGVTASAGQPRR